MTLKELREKAGELAKQMREMTDLIHKEDRDFTSEEEEKWKRLNDEYDRVAKNIERAAKLAKIDDELNDLADEQDRHRKPGTSDHQPGEGDERDLPEVNDETRERAIQGWFRQQCGEPVSDEQRDAAEAVGLDLNRRYLDINLDPTRNLRQLQQAYHSHHETIREQRALSAVTGSTGGNLVPEELIRRLEIQMLAFGSVMQAAEIITTASGERMAWPTANDTTNKGRQIGENQPVSSTNQPNFGQLFWDAHKFTSDELLVPTELLEDATFDLNMVLNDMLGERIGRILEEKFTTGTGAATPHGIVTASAAGETAASATAIGVDDLIALEHSVDPAYRNGAAYMFHDTVLEHLRKLKDGEGRPLWTSGMADGFPDRIHNRPYFINQEMASVIASGAKSVLFGQLSKYKVRMVRTIRFYRLVERHRENDQDAFLAFVRADGNLLNVGSPVKHLVHP